MDFDWRKRASMVVDCAGRESLRVCDEGLYICIFVLKLVLERRMGKSGRTCSENVSIPKVELHAVIARSQGMPVIHLN